MELDTPRQHVPDITVATDYEIQQLQSVTPPDVQELNDIHTRTTTRQQTHCFMPITPQYSRRNEHIGSP